MSISIRRHLQNTPELVPTHANGQQNMQAMLEHHRHADPIIRQIVSMHNVPMPPGGFKLTVHARSMQVVHYITHQGQIQRV